MGYWPNSRWDISSGATVREEATQRQHYSTLFLRNEIIPGHHLAAWHTVWEELSMCNMKRLREFGFKSSSQQGLTTDLPPGGYEITKCFILLILHMNSLNSFPVPPSSPFFPPSTLWTLSPVPWPCLPRPPMSLLGTLSKWTGPSLIFCRISSELCVFRCV